MEAASPVEAGSPKIEGSDAGGNVDATRLAIDHGGNHNGHARADGLVPGSPEAIKADRDRDAKRKREARKIRRQTLAKALPSLPAMEAEPAGPLPSLDTVETAAPVSTVIPWNPRQLESLGKLLVNTIERWDVRTLREMATEIPGCPASLLDTIETDAAWNPDAKAEIIESASELVAEWLNAAGIDSRNHRWLRLITACLAIKAGRETLVSKLESMRGDGRTPGRTDGRTDT